MATRKKPRREGGPSHAEPGKPAGNAQFDPAEQTTRRDMPLAEQKSEGQPRRGTAPPRGEERSKPPESPEAGE